MERKKQQETDCGTCVYFDYDELMEADVCTLSLDEDEMLRFMQDTRPRCPYYKFYNEYKTAQKQ